VQGSGAPDVKAGVFRRGSRQEAPPEKSSPGVDQQPSWLAGVEAKPGGVRAGPTVALFGDKKKPHRPAEQQKSGGNGQQGHHPAAPSPLRGVSLQEVLDALARPFSPPQLDWELVGVAYVHAAADELQEVDVWLVKDGAAQGAIDDAPADVVLVDHEGDVVMVEAQTDVPTNEPVDAVLVEELHDIVAAEELPPAPEPAPEEAPGPYIPAHASALGSAALRKRKALREHEQIMAAVRELTWEGYCSLIADIFRQRGYEVFVGEGADGDVIDMEVVQAGERMLVNCQLRGMSQIDAAPIAEMTQVAARNGAHGAFVITDGDFAEQTWSFAKGQPVVLIDRDALLGLVLDFTLGVEREKKLGARLARLLRGPETKGREKAS
jgi:hypothetical protein